MYLLFTRMYSRRSARDLVTCLVQYFESSPQSIVHSPQSIPFHRQSGLSLVVVIADDIFWYNVGDLPNCQASCDCCDIKRVVVDICLPLFVLIMGFETVDRGLPGHWCQRNSIDKIKIEKIRNGFHLQHIDIF